MEYRSCMKRIGTKSCKISIYGQKFRGSTGTKTGRYRYTTQHNQIDTGTEQSGTGTTVSKMPRLCSFAYLSLNSHTDCIGILLND